MKYNLKKTKTSDAETIEHLLTVLKGIFLDGEEILEDILKNKKDNWKDYDKNFKEAKKYLCDYIDELFKQNYENN